MRIHIAVHTIFDFLCFSLIIFVDMAKESHGAQLSFVDEINLAPEPSAADKAGVKLTDKWLEPPFSVLNAGSDRWQSRKRDWISLGIQSELGRGENALGLSGEANEAARYDKDEYRARMASPGRSLMPAATLGTDGKTVRGDGKGRSFARTFGQDLMRGEHSDGADYSKSGAVIPSGGGGMADRLANNERGKPLTWHTGPDLDFMRHRNKDAIPGGAGENSVYRDKGARYGDTVAIKTQGWCQENIDSGCAQNHSGTSIFDPVLCEVMYYWYCPPGGFILDPFAGGSVRGIVAARLGRRYVGIELRPEQVEANRAQWERIKNVKGQHYPFPDPIWIVGDSRNLGELAKPAAPFDFIFSCPPYFDLEVYSDDPNDLSTLGWEGFCEAYNSIIAQACALLKPNRFAAFVTGDVREPKGRYRRFPNYTVDCFERAGLWLHNEIVLYTAIGSASIRAPKQFTATRKCVKTHQNVHSFCKGDAKLAASILENA